MKIQDIVRFCLLSVRIFHGAAVWNLVILYMWMWLKDFLPVIIQKNSEQESASFTPLAGKPNVALEFFDYFLRDYKTKAYATSIFVFRGINEPKQFE